MPTNFPCPRRATTLLVVVSTATMEFVERSAIKKSPSTESTQRMSNDVSAAPFGRAIAAVGLKISSAEADATFISKTEANVAPSHPTTLTRLAARSIHLFIAVLPPGRISAGQTHAPDLRP